MLSRRWRPRGVSALLFISDIHLGFQGSRAGELLRFLRGVVCDKLYLVGDIVDFYRMRGRWHWPCEHHEVLHRLLEFARHGTEVILIPGNHDAVAREFIGLEFAGVRLRADDVHETADGRQLLVTHGDQYDAKAPASRFPAELRSFVYDRLVWLDRVFNNVRRLFGASYLSLTERSNTNSSALVPTSMASSAC